MNTAINHLEAVRTMARDAETKIRKQTGMGISLMVCPPDNQQKTPEQMMQKIASVLHMSPECYVVKMRQRDIVDLRFIAAHLLRRYFPGITLNDIALYFGGRDHTTIINALRKTNDLLQTNDLCFTTKYYHVIRALNEWIND
jgi:chromosomal replication initiation ATPase DnaA